MSLTTSESSESSLTLASKMAENEGSVNDCIEVALDSINELKESDRRIILKEEQLLAVKDLLAGKDVLAILPTGFGKSMIFTVFCFARREWLNRAGKDGTTSVLVISPLKSLIEDQIMELRSMNCTAEELNSGNISQIAVTPPQFIYCTAEEALGKKFLNVLKDSNSKLHQSLAAVVVDESHTVETWTGKRKDKGKASEVFRSAYGKISILRSMCKQETPFLALTGTADEQTTRTIAKDLVLKNFTSVFVSPNRKNLRISVRKVKRDKMLKELDWVVDSMKENGRDTPKTIIFCPTMYAIASVVNYLMRKAGKKAFVPQSSKKWEHCLVGIFHSMTHQEYKKRVVESLKGNGLKRVVVATTALSMGVNFPDIRFVVMWGPSRNLLDFHQEAGRGGRDGLPSDVVVYYYGQQLAHCEDDVRSFVKATDCYRIASYKTFDKTITSLVPAHDCCNLCAATCKCNCTGTRCESHCKQFEINSSPQQPLPVRDVDEAQKEVLSQSLSELQSRMAIKVGSSLFGAVPSHGFSKELIDDVVENASFITDMKDIQTLVPVFSNAHAQMILEVFNEIFDDIDDTTLQPEQEMFEQADADEQSFNLYDLVSNSDYDTDLEDVDLDFLE